MGATGERGMPRLAVLGGVAEVGGNKVMLEQEGHVLFLDFGISYKRRSHYYEEYVNPRAALGLLDLLEMRLLPPLEGLYRPDLHPPFPFWERYRELPTYYDLRGAQVEGVLCSHAHLDHSGYISALREEVPVLTSLLSALIMKAIQDTSQPDFEQQVVYYSPRQARPDSGLLEPCKGAEARQRPFYVFSSHVTDAVQRFWQDIPAARGLASALLKPVGEEMQLGPFYIRHFPVDHSIPGAGAFLVEVGGIAVAYTGDLRFHGGQASASQAFAQALGQVARRLPLVLLCEGTRVGDEHQEPVSEEMVAQRALSFMQEAQGLIIADFGPRNLERLAIFHRLASHLGRQLVITAKDAYLVEKARLADPSLPPLDACGNVLLYHQPKLRVQRWEQETYARHRHRLVDPEDVHRHQDQMILCFSYYDLKDLPSIRPRPGSLYLYSNHEAFDEEIQMDFRRLRHWLEHFGLRYVGLPREELNWRVPPEEAGLHASGHAPAHHLMQLIQEVRPHLLVPLHTEHPEWFAHRLKGSATSVHLPQEGESLDLARLLG
jgi:ribonuclease J